MSARRELPSCRARRGTIRGSMSESTRYLWKVLRWFVLGALLLVYVIRVVVGVQPIFAALGRVGFGFFIVVAINGMRHVLRTISMRLAAAIACFGKAKRTLASPAFSV